MEDLNESAAVLFATLALGVALLLYLHMCYPKADDLIQAYRRLEAEGGYDQRYHMAIEGAVINSSGAGLSASELLTVFPKEYRDNDPPTSIFAPKGKTPAIEHS